MKRAFATALAIMGVTTVSTALAQPPAPGPLPRVTEELPIVDDLAKNVHFYHDLLGLEATYDPRVYLLWWRAVPFIEDLYGVKGLLRNVHLVVPEAAFEIEASEWQNAKGKALHPRLQDTGASRLILHVRNIDKLVGYLKQGGAKVVTTGDEPVVVASATGTLRAIVFEDPNGFFVELVQSAALPPNRSGPGPGPGQPPFRPLPYVYGADVTVTVADLDRSAQFFRDVFGLNVAVDASARADAKHTELYGMRGAQYREAVIAWPDKTPQLHLIQFSGIEHKTLTPLVADPNATLIRVLVRDMRSTVAKIKAFPDAKIMNLSGGPTTPEMRFDHIPWLVVRLPGGSTYLQIVQFGGRG